MKALCRPKEIDKVEEKGGDPINRFQSTKWKMDTFRLPWDLTLYIVAKDSHPCFRSPIFWFDKDWIKANKKHSKFV
jgi:hypothetical protein